MKTILYVIALIMAFVMGIFVESYYNSYCTEEKPLQVETNEVFKSWFNDSIPFNRDVMDIVEQDKDYMAKIDTNYRWFEVNVKLAGTVDTLTEPTIEYIGDVFQIEKESDSTTDVYLGKHEGSQLNYFDIHYNAFWVGDCDLRGVKEVFLPFSTIYENLQKANCKKPNSQYVTLRRQLGPHLSNPQWIFGNDNRGLVFVDAITGNVSTTNPTFGK